MGKIIIILAVFAVVIIFVAGIIFSTKTNQPPSQTCKVGSTRTIEMNENGFSPSEITIKHCDKVTFKNTGIEPHWPASDIHPTHGIYPEFDPKVGIMPSKSWSFVFDRVGRWRMHDHLMPLFRGRIIVLP